MSHLQSLVLGTAGHIDHGKSTLIKALTGVDPDRLAEEKKRGITIELGFGEIVTPTGQHFGVVDVPGHEKFVRHMVAGATGIDAALIIIAADDGVMVQTREHLAILELLGITEGIVVVTKIDKSDPELIELVKADIADELKDSPFGNAPLVAVSSITGEGIDELYVQLDALAERVSAQKKAAGKAPLRLPVDRVFTIAGAGTVITGTLWEGAVSQDEQIEAVFAHRSVRVRSVQVHGESVERAGAGNRVALNLAGVSKDDINRGEMLTAPGLVKPTTRFNASFTYLGSERFGGSSKAFKSGMQVHIHHATREVNGQLFLLGEKSVQPNTTCFVQIRTQEPLALMGNDRFVVRSFSPALTIGGGEVLLAHAPRRLKVSDAEMALLTALGQRDYEAIVARVLELSRTPLTSEHIARKYHLVRSEVAAVLNQNNYHRIKVGSDTYFVTQAAHGLFKTSAEKALLALHEQRPEQHAFTLAEMRDALHVAYDETLFEAWIQQIREEGAPFIYEQGRIAHAQSAAATKQAEQAVASALLVRLSREGLSVSTLDELVAQENYDARLLQKVANALVAQGVLVRLAQKYYFTAESLETARKALERALEGSSVDHTIPAATLRDALGVSRKYAIPLLEYFDAQGITRREGDGRYLV